MNRSTSIVLQLTKQGVRLCHQAAIRHGGAISLAAHNQALYGTCVGHPVSGPLGRYSNFVNTRTHYSVRWLSSAPTEDDTNVFYPGLVKMIESQDIQLIDVREPEELQKWGMIARSFNIPLGKVREDLQLDETQFREKYGRPKPSKGDKNIVFHCRSGVRSLKAVQAAQAEGYPMARHFPGGWLEWAKENNLPGE